MSSLTVLTLDLLTLNSLVTDLILRWCVSFQLHVPVLGESGSYLLRRLQTQVSWHENGGATAATNQEVQTGAPEAKQLKKPLTVNL